MKSSLLHLRSIFYALAGFCLWVFADSCMKLAGEANLPPPEVVSFLGIFAALTITIISVFRGRAKDLVPQHPQKQILRGLMAFGCVIANTIALKHLPLTLFYVVVFTSPMMIAVLATVFLREHLTVAKIIAIFAGFAGVVIAINPWDHFGGGDLVGYAAAFCSALLYAVATVLTSKIGRAGTLESMVIATAMIEAVLGFGLTLGHFVPIPLSVFLILAAMGAMNAVGNYWNALALRHTAAATVEQFHYTQIVIGAVIGFLIWHDVPTLPEIAGAAVIILSGMYVAAQEHMTKSQSVAAVDP